MTITKKPFDSDKRKRHSYQLILWIITELYISTEQEPQISGCDFQRIKIGDIEPKNHNNFERKLENILIHNAAFHLD